MENINTTISGGSHLSERKLRSLLDPKFWNDIDLILNNPLATLDNDGRKKVLWNQHNWNQPVIVEGFKVDAFNRFDRIVFVSYWQFDRYCLAWKEKLPIEKCVVIRNAIDPLKTSLSDAPRKLVFTSTPFRGLDYLIHIFDRLKDKFDLELNVFSSTEIYGSNYDKTEGEKYSGLFESMKSIKGIKNWGFVSNDIVRQVVSESDIFLYPSTFEETSCISAIEAGSAGLRLILSNYGALFETCNVYAAYSSYSPRLNKEAIVNGFVNLLEREIQAYPSFARDDRLEQSRYFNSHYCWNKRVVEWEKLFDTLLGV